MIRIRVVLYVAILAIIVSVILRKIDDSNAAENNESDRMRITIPQGELEGIRLRTRKGIPYWGFLGIPYAKPPIGSLRFKDPLPPKNWTGVYDATKLRESCPQMAPYIITYAGNEDCLQLYINVKNVNESNLLPVVVFFNGGVLRTVQPYDELESDVLIEEANVVFINLYYRLNVMGLLSLETKEVPGNAIFKDQVMALRWIQNNIKHFGGDPNNVMIWGHSSGGTAVSLHHSSAMSKGLFHKAVSHSPMPICQWKRVYDSVNVALNLANILGYNSTNPDNLLPFLQNVPVERLVEENWFYEGEDNWELGKMGPVVEKQFEDTEQFMSVNPCVAYETKQFNDVPLILSYTSIEIGYVDIVKKTYLEYKVFPKPTAWLLDSNVNQTEDFYKKLMLEFYVGQDELDLENIDHLQTLLLMCSDAFIVVPTLDFCERVARRGNSPVYLMRLSYRESHNLKFVDMYGLQGAIHEDDIRYMFSNDVQFIERSPEDYVSKRLIQILSNFAYHSDPTYGLENHLLPVKWKPITNTTMNYMEMSGEFGKGRNPDWGRFQFWKKLEQRLVKEKNCDRNWRDTCYMKC